MYNEKVLSFFNAAGSDYDFTDVGLEIGIKKNRGDDDFITITEGNGITITGNDVHFVYNEEQSATFKERPYYWQLRRTIDGNKKVWLNGDHDWHNGKFDAFNDSGDTIQINDDGDIINVTINEGGGITQAELDAALALKADLIAEDMPEYYGALGDGSTDDSAAFILSIAAIGTKGVLKLSANKTYVIGHSVTLPIGLSMIGYGAKIKRANATSTTLTAEGTSGATSITVAATTGFAVGDQIIVINASLSNGGRGYLENSASVFGTTPQTITDITGLTITFSNALSMTCPNGSVVVRVYDLFIGGQSTTTVTGLGNIIEGIEFDGNRSNNNYTNSWVFNKMIDDLPSKTMISKCTFHDAPCENIFISNQTTISDCHFYDLNGSQVHVSQAPSSNSGGCMFINNRGRNICLATNAVTGHSEAAFTFSASPDEVICMGNEVRDCSEEFISPFSNISPHLSIIGNKGFNCKGVINIVNLGVGAIVKSFIMSDNYFESCGYVYINHLGSITGNLVEKDSGYDRILISDNAFINMKVSMQRCSQFTFDNNKIITNSDHTYSSTDVLAGLKASLNMTRCTHYRIRNNEFDNRAVSADTRLTTAINCEYDFNLNLALAQPVKTSGSVSTEYCYYNRSVIISGNTVNNYTLGILDYYAGSEILPARSLSWIGFTISNNTITLRPSGAAYGIVCGPGSIVHDNKIYSVSTSVAALVALGVNDGTGSTYNTGGTQSARLNGAIVYRNTIIGANTSIVVGSTNATFGNNIYNAQVRDNFVDGTVTDNSSGNSTVSGNVTLINETLTIQILRDNAGFY